MKKVRLIDVANKAGVSKSTASQYINGRYNYMSEATKERIANAIKELNFVPNQLARGLKTHKTQIIGVIVQNIMGPTTSQVIRGIDDYCKKQGYNVLIYNSDYIESVEKQSIETLRSLGADGLILSSSGQINPLLNEVDKSELPIVHIHRDFDNLKVNKVFSDFYKGAYDATKYLLSLGHERIAVLTRPYLDIHTRKNRITGYNDALLSHQIMPNEKLIHIVKNENDIIESYKKLMALPNPPTVIFSMYALITIDLLSYLNEKSISIPEDISVMGFDDLPLAHLLKTPLTAINQSAYTLGEKSAELLLNKINSPHINHDNITLPCHLLIRDSCKDLKA